jgi:serine phosphatase RsbU (regulator of sigma subunit)
MLKIFANFIEFVYQWQTRLLILFVMFAYSHSLYAQSTSSNFNNSLKRAANLTTNHPDSALQLLQHLRMQNNDIALRDSNLALLFITSSDCYKNTGDIDKCAKYLDSAEFYYFKSNNNLGLGNVFHNKGNQALFKGNTQLAIDYYQKAIMYRQNLNSKDDLAKTLSNLGIAFFRITQFDSSMHYHEKTLKIRTELKDSTGIANTLSNIGNIFLYKANDTKAIEYYLQAIQYIDTISPSRIYASLMNNIGNIFNHQGKNSQALTYFLDALKVFEKYNDQQSIARIYNNLALIHLDQQNIEQAMRYHFEALEYFTLSQDESGIADTYFYLGRIYHQTKSFVKAKYYFLQALQLETKNKDMGGKADCQHNLGVIYLDNAQYDSALFYLNQAKDEYQIIGNRYGLTTAQGNLAILYLKANKNKKAYQLAQQSLKNAQSFNGIKEMADAYSVIYQSLEAMGEYKKSLEYIKKYLSLSDSIFTQQKTQAILEIESKYQLEKKQQAIDLQKMQLAKRDLEFKNKEKEIALQKKIRNVILMTMMLMSILIFILIRSLIHRKTLNNKLSKQRQDILHKNEELAQLNEELKVQQQQIIEQNNALVRQNTKIEESNRAWHEGVKYAEYIQQAVLPSNQKMESIFSQHFVMYEPKEIVGGDFYWMHQSGNKLLVAVGDCTGHGVPGGFLSMLSIALIKEIVAIKNNFKPNEVLDALRHQMIESLQQTGDMLDYTDGIDLSLLVIDTKKQTLEYSGAKSKVIVCSKAQTILLKGDRMPVGYSPKMHPFTSEKLAIDGTETIYMFTDGLIDQYNTNDEKFGIQRLLSFCKQNQNKSLKVQKEILFQEFIKWQAGFEQIDDTTVLVFKI